MSKYGAFISPNPTKMSDLENDNNYIIIREYVLDAASLAGTTSIKIDDIEAGNVITNIGLNVTTPFVSSNNNDTIEVVTDSGIVLMDKTWNDPNAIGNYTTDCVYEIVGNPDEIIINHTLSGMTAGYAILRIEMYGNNATYEELLTSDNTVYTTKDNVATEVNK